MVVPMKLAATTCLMELRSEVWSFDAIGAIFLVCAAGVDLHPENWVNA
jgi:hypothetical protein